MQKCKTEQNKKYLTEFHFYYSYTSQIRNFTRNDTAPEDFLHTFC